eukprot:jgi/Pico_ML_1/51684/g255.t1
MGVASRRASEALIFDGMVTVNGQVVTTPQTRVDPRKDKIRVRGKTLASAPPRSVYYALNKPKGYLCSSKSDTGSGKLVLDLFDERLRKDEEQKKKGGDSKSATPRLFTVGRLDVATTGLLLVTNDGQWAQKVSHPSNGLTKEYVITAEHKITKAQFNKVAEGTDFDGTHIRPVAVAPVSDGAEKMRIVVNEGKYHEERIEDGSGRHESHGSHDVRFLEALGVLVDSFVLEFVHQFEGTIQVAGFSQAADDGAAGPFVHSDPFILQHDTKQPFALFHVLRIREGFQGDVELFPLERDAEGLEGA